MRELMLNTEIAKIANHYWTAVKTKPRCEKKLASYCNGNNVPYYLPLIKSAKRQQRQNIVFYLPMFSGYVFCCLDNDKFNQIVKSNCVVNKLKIDDEQEKILIEELRAIKLIEENSEQLEIIVKPEIVEGSKVKVVSGPLQGLTGVVAKRKNKYLVIANLELLGQSVSAEIDIEHLEVGEV